MRALVLGGSGAVGRVVAAQLERLGWRTTRASRQNPHAPLDLRAPSGIDALHALARTHELVINASGIEDAGLVSAVAPTAYVDITATGRVLAELRDAALPGQRVLLGAGLVPGLSTMLIAELPTKAGDDIDLGVILGSGERHGPAAVAWTAALAGRAVFAPPERDLVVNLRESRRLTAPGGTRRYLRADFPDHVLLGSARDIRVRSYLALGDRLTTAALGLVGRVPRLARAVARAPHLGDDRWSLVARNRRTGEQRAASGRGQSRTTGILTALGADALVRRSTAGVVTLADLLELDALPDFAAPGAATRFAG